MPDNQTREEWLDLPTVAGNPNAKGTGVVVKAAGGSKEFIDSVEYEALVEQAESENWDAYSWVPVDVATPDQVKAATCSGRCAGKCRPGCICNRSKGRCT